MLLSLILPATGFFLQLLQLVTLPWKEAVGIEVYTLLLKDLDETQAT